MRKIKNKLTKKQWLIWIGLLLFVLFFVWNKNLTMLLLDGDVEAVHIFLDKNIGYSLAFMALIMLIQNSFTVFPLILVITINITLFGFINGFLWSWLTSVFASAFVYYCVRYVFQDLIIEKFNTKLLDKIDTNGFAYVFQARIFPFVPTSLVNILAGLSTIRIFPYLLATATGNFLYFFILGLIPAGILSAELDEYIIWAVIVTAVFLYYVFKMVKRKRKSASSNIDALEREVKHE